MLPEFLQLEVLKRKIRYAEEPDNPSLIKRFFQLDTPTTADETLLQRRLRLRGQYVLLFETIEDGNNPRHWRQTCLNVIYRPLYELQILANSNISKQDVSLLFTRLRSIDLGA
ncbi:MAG: hypothetical protein ACK5HY_07065 [Parahaliea sp.]